MRRWDDKKDELNLRKREAVAWGTAVLLIALELIESPTVGFGNRHET